MIAVLRRLAGLRVDTRGSMAIETALVAPVLVLMSLGGFEISSMVARQHELQSGAAEAEAVALAANMGAETDVNKLKKVLQDSLDLKGDQVKVTKQFRCNGNNQLLATADTCLNDDDILSSYVKLEITDTYKPIWSKIGISGDFKYKVQRMVQLS